MDLSELNPEDEHRHVLIVDDEPRLRQMLERAVREMEFFPHVAESAESAQRVIEEHACDIAVLDVNLPGMDGMTFFGKLRERCPDVQVVILTGYGDLETAKRAIHLDVVDFLTKPCSLADLEAALGRALKRRLDAAKPKPLPELPSSMRGPVEDDDMPAPVGDAPAAPETRPGMSLPDVEREHIIATLRRHGGNRSGAAKELGISVRTLYYRLATYQDAGHEID